ncbi:MAG: hypothetical protein AB7M05_14500 [Alphaproteobacteria bacterium]
MALAMVIFGGVVLLIGLVMLARGYGKGRNAIKAFGAEFELSNSAVVVILVGAGLMVAPFFFGAHPLQVNTAAPAPQAAAPAPTSTPAPAPASAPAPVAAAGAIQQPAAPVPTEVAETEPNNDFTRAIPIAMGATVHGQLSKKDVDYYKFRTSSHYKHDVRMRFEADRGAQFTLRIYDAQKNQELEQFLAFEIAYDAKFIAKPDTEYVIELENRPDWTATNYTFTLNEN